MIASRRLHSLRAHRWELAAVDSGGSAKLAEAAAAYDLTSFVLASVVGADGPASCIDRRIACPGPAR